MLRISPCRRSRLWNRILAFYPLLRLVVVPSYVWGRSLKDLLGNCYALAFLVLLLGPLVSNALAIWLSGWESSFLEILAGLFFLELDDANKDFKLITPFSLPPSAGQIRSEILIDSLSNAPK